MSFILIELNLTYNLNELSLQGKKQAEHIIEVYNNLANENKLFKQLITNKIKKIKDLKKASNTNSKRYTTSRINANKSLSYWVGNRYADCDYIRTKQDVTNNNRDGTFYLYRLLQLALFYKNRYRFTNAQLNSIQTWYLSKMQITVPGVGIIDCEDILFNDLLAGTYPNKNVTNGYAVAFDNSNFSWIYDTLKFSYVIDYPSNLSKFEEYNPIITVPVEIAILVDEKTYNGVSKNIYDLFSNIISIRNNIFNLNYKNVQKYRVYKDYINENIVTKSNLMNNYNISLSSHITSVYLKDYEMNSSLWLQSDRLIFDDWIWPSKIINAKNTYRTEVYPKLKDGSYGEDFYTIYTFQ